MPGLFRSGNWNENDVNILSRINWRASLVPTAAVIPAPIAYIKVVAVKKLVDNTVKGVVGTTSQFDNYFFCGTHSSRHRLCHSAPVCMSINMTLLHSAVKYYENGNSCMHDDIL
jgi:hypothetical protein